MSAHIANARRALADATMIVRAAADSLGNSQQLLAFTVRDLVEDLNSAQRCMRLALAELDAELRETGAA